MQIDHLIPTIPISNLKKRNRMDFAVLADNKVKIKESEMTNKYLDFAREKKVERSGLFFFLI